MNARGRPSPVRRSLLTPRLFVCICLQSLVYVLPLPFVMLVFRLLVGRLDYLLRRTYPLAHDVMKHTVGGFSYFHANTATCRAAFFPRFCKILPKQNARSVSWALMASWTSKQCSTQHLGTHSRRFLLDFPPALLASCTTSRTSDFLKQCRVHYFAGFFVS